MTQYHAVRKFTLSGAPRHVKVLITAFNVVVLVALLVGVVNYWDKTGMTPSGVRAWYRGNEGESEVIQTMTFEKTFRELLDATHPHLFGQGVLLFILAHIVALTGLSERKKIAVYLVSFGAMLLDAAMPWLIRYVSQGLAPLSIASLILLTGMFALQAILPIREMWFVRPRGRSSVAAALVILSLLGGRTSESVASPEDSDREHRRLWLVMGTTCEVVIRTDDQALAGRGFEAAWRELALVDSLMSLYRPESEISRVNREAAAAPCRVSEPVFTVIAAAQAVAASSDGAFDITVKPLMDTWGFYRKAGHRPGAAAIDSARTLTGWRKLELDADARTVRFDVPGMAIDLGGIAKGYALDRAMASLARLGIADALIDLGGNILARGSAGEEAPGWPVAVRDAAHPDSVTSLAWLRDEAIASSGGYEKFVVLDGVVYGHILDPARGEPVAGVLGTSVVTRDAMLGDALSTTIYVLGERALDWLARRHPDVEAAVTLRDGATGNTFYSAGSQLAPRHDPRESDTNRASARAAPGGR